MKKIVAAGLVAAALAVALVVVVASREQPGEMPAVEKGNTVQPIADVSRQRIGAKAGETPGAARGDAASDAPQGEDSAEERQPPQTEEEKAAAEEEARVEAFDNLTDKWLEPKKAGVTMKDIADFVAAFRAVPKSRKDECIHRALNLIPDDNVMLLAGVLMDKTEDKETVETVFSDILNRDEEVKKPILSQIYADKTHPCWADTAWILDVTGELPAQK